ncbi:hypothetical protein ANO11243_049560 [Dothideomycetidae sp. 11243]|nr:hypothetical protein ANO11243_049560 [fungal sp. No.11243]
MAEYQEAPDENTWYANLYLADEWHCALILDQGGMVWTNSTDPAVGCSYLYRDHTTGP